MRYFIDFFLKRSLLVNIILIAIFILAFAAVGKMTRNKFPEVDLGTMIISTRYPGASPKDVEQNVTRLIEDELKTVTGIDIFKSVSAENFSSITVNIDINHPNQQEVKDDIRRAVDKVSGLPSEVVGRPLVRDLKASEMPVLVVGVSGDIEYEELRNMAKNIERDIKRIDGVSMIDKYAFRDKEFHVDLDPNKLEGLYIALNDVLYSISNRNIRATGGNLESYSTQRNILTLSQFETIDDIQNVIIRSELGGGTVRIRDVGTVKDEFEDERMRTIFNGKQGIMLVIKKSSTADIIRVVDKVKVYLEDKQKSLPSTIKLSAVNDETRIVRNRLDVVQSNAYIGFVLVVIILIIFLDFWSSFLIALSIPISFAITFVIMKLVNADINSISLAAMIIALGMIVDQSIVISENALVYISTGKKKYEAILEATMEVIVPVFASVLTTVLSFAPMFAMSGIMGKFISVIPVVIIASLTGSLLNSWFILPNHLSHVIKEVKPGTIHIRTWQDKFFDYISFPYKKLMKTILKHSYITIILTIMILIFSMWWAKNKVLFNLFPPDGADTFFVYVELPDDATFNATEGVVKEIEKFIKEIPEKEIAFYTAKIGTNQSNELAMPVGGDEYLAYIQVTLVPSSKRKRDAGIILDELKQKIVANVKGTKEMRFEVQKPGPPAGKPIELHIHSDNDKFRAMFVSKIMEELKITSGVSDVTSNAKLGREEYKLDINYGTLAVTGLTVKDVANTLRIAFDGVRATSVVKNNEEIDIRVRFPAEHRQDVRNVLGLQIRNREGKLVPIKSFAKLSKVRAETAIHHTEGDVTTTVLAQTTVTTVPQQVIDGVIRKFSPELKDYPGVSFSYGGEAEKSKESVKSLLFAFIGGIIAIYLVITLLFGSVTQPTIVLLAIPFGLIGVIWSFYFHGRPFSFLGLIGVIGLSGIVVNNSIMMVEFINKIVVDKMAAVQSFSSLELIDDIIEGAARRLRPIVITTATTVFGLLPTAYGIGGADPFIEPMVLALAYGIIVSTFITLILIPAFYMANLDGYFFGQRVLSFTKTKIASRKALAEDNQNKPVEKVEVNEIKPAKSKKKKTENKE
ncbi:MAG: efflux RND transporter permease subunit [Leptospiraceae bacterium]|nr:efflux RND transporter permease subunit [Leptospiraceae bacterium]